MTEALDISPDPKDLTLCFDNLVFHEGINITVRNGAKWINKARMGDVLWCVESGAEDEPDFTYSSSVAGLLYTDIDSIPAGLHKLNHDPKCRTIKGVRAELERIYGPTPWPHHRNVTVLFFPCPVR